MLLFDDIWTISVPILSLIHEFSTYTKENPSLLLVDLLTLVLAFAASDFAHNCTAITQKQRIGCQNLPQ